jgi:predicted dehydrogenase
VHASFNYYQDFARASMIAHLADCIQQDSQPVISGEHAVHVLEIMLKALQSAREGRALELETTFPFGTSV